MKRIGRFWIETKNFDDGNLYRARGPYGMCGVWHEDEEMASYEFLNMAKQIKLDEYENEQILSIYETVHDL